MVKYDFGYELDPNTTNYWAYRIINEKSKVLELGSSIGLLTKNLYENKNCIVDIVEIDHEAGERAKPFARNACLGGSDGNLESAEWIEKLDGEKYDYIVLLDVLEHLINPGKVLKNLKSFLKTDGKILLSVPNIAHNSVLINLLNNKFEYSKLGLLDDTHVHFFTLSSLKDLIRQCGYKCCKQEYIQKLVGDNEISNSYENVPKQVEAFLRTRELADIYQLLFVLEDSSKHHLNNVPEIIPQNLKYTQYAFEVYHTNQMIYELSYAPQRKIDICFELKDFRGNIRIDPLNVSCILKNIEIWSIKEKDKVIVDIQETNGLFIQDMLVFNTDDPQILIHINTEKSTYIQFKADIILFADPAIPYLYDAIKDTIPRKISLRNDYIQIYYSTDRNVYDRTKCYELRINNDKTFEQSIYFKNEEVQFIRIDPLSVSCKVIIDRISVRPKYSDDIINFDLTTNADFSDDNEYLFLHNDPQIIIGLEERKRIDYIDIKLTISEDIEEDCIKIKNLLYETENVNKSLSEKLEVISEKNKDLKTNIKKLQGNIKESESFIGELEGNIRKLQNNVQELQNNIKESEDLIRELEGNISESEKNNMELNNMIKIMKDKEWFGTKKYIRRYMKKYMKKGD